MNNGSQEQSSSMNNNDNNNNLFPCENNVRQNNLIQKSVRTFKHVNYYLNYISNNCQFL